MFIVLLCNLQVPDKAQRLEELAIKQSRQLIPMTPTMPKALVRDTSVCCIIFCDSKLPLFSGKTVLLVGHKRFT